MPSLADLMWRQAWMLRLGKGDERLSTMEIYRLAADQGYAMAQYNLGVMYGNGRGVVQNYVTAHMWGNIARANGNDIADELLDDLEQLMSKDQIARAQQRASDCMANQYKNC